MKMFIQLFLSFAFTLLSSHSAFAFKPSNAEYSANVVFETKEGSFRTKVFNSASHERREMSESGANMITIINKESKTMYMLMPDEGMYMEISGSSPMASMAPKQPEMDDYNFEQTEVGKETINGVATTKYKMIMTSKSKPDMKLGGFFWLSKEDILVKMDAMSVDKKSKDRIKIELTDLKIEKQNQSLFEIPSNLQKMSMPGF